MNVKRTNWRKVGSAYMLRDDYSTIYARRVDRKYHLIYRNPNPMQSDWLTLGVYATLTEALTEGSELMGKEA